jgi:hypothetical protein
MLGEFDILIERKYILCQPNNNQNLKHTLLFVGSGSQFTPHVLGSVCLFSKESYDLAGS